MIASGGNEICFRLGGLKEEKTIGFLADQDGYIHGLISRVPFLGQDSSALLSQLHLRRNLVLL